MADVEKIGTKEAASFMEQWKKHPLSIPILIILLNLSFLLVLVQGKLDDNRIQLAYIFSIFSVLMFLIVVAVLVWRKFVFYNVTELIISEVERHIQTIQESLSNIEIGIGVAFDDLQAPPVSDEVTNNVRRFEFLSLLMKNAEYEPKLNDEAKKALAKFFFKISKFERALGWLDQVKNKSDSEYNFIRGLLLWKKGDSEESRNCFKKSINPKANYYKFITYVSTHGGDMTKEGLNTFIHEASKKSSPLYSDIYAQIHLCVAHWRIGLYFPPEGAEIGVESLQKALQIAEHLITIENHAFAYFNAACYISRLGKLQVDLDGDRSFDRSLYINLALGYLEKGLAQKSYLLKNTARDEDLEWLKETAGKDYFSLLGKFYAGQTH